MPNKKLIFNIWGRDLDLEIVYDCFEGEEITHVQNETYNQFIDCSEQIFKDSFYRLKEYCLNNYASFITDDFDNIYKYIKPKQIYIKRSVTGKKIAGLLCNFKFDIEHGLAVYIEDGKVKSIGTQDIIL